MKKMLVVALASLALAVAANFGLASAHPFAEPTPPANPTPRVDNSAPAAPSATETDVEQEGNNQDGANDQSETDLTQNDGEMNDSAGAPNDETTAADTTTTPKTTTTTTTAKDQQGDQGNQDRNTQQDGESEGDN
jgi:Skp family chaperone for outer membrane proteins